MRGAVSPEKLFAVGGAIAVLAGLYVSSLHSYLLFHSLIEIFTISIAFALFFLTWNTRKYIEGGYLRIIGIGYGFIALIDLAHTLAYKGMMVFPGYTADLPTQLWIAARYLQAFTLLLAPLWVRRGPSDRIIVAAYVAAVTLLLAAVFSGYFPSCYIEGEGLTTFKIASEYLISGLLGCSLYFLYVQRRHFSRKVYRLIAASIIFTILSELAFTTYVNVYGIANLIGHYFKLVQFYLIYRAILVVGVEAPFDLIFRDFKQVEDALLKTQDTLEDRVRQRTAALALANEQLQRSEARYRRMVDTTSEGVWELGPDWLTTFVNARMPEMLGVRAEDMLGRPVTDFMFEEDVPDHLQRMESLQKGQSEQYECRYRCKDGRTIWTLASAAPIFDGDKRFQGAFAMFTDITKRKGAEEELRRYKERLETVAKERTAELEAAVEKLEHSNRERGA